MASHGRVLLRLANQWSLCHDDAMDAYQRGLEIFLRRADMVHPATEVAWLKVVIKHEALAIRRSRQETVSGEEPDLDAQAPRAQRTLDEVAAGGERVDRSAEALRALKPDERRALLMKAEGYSYTEIGERCGWTYTKVNRAITEGRRRFMEVYRAIESGDACERFSSTLAALAGGRATSAEIVEIRPHLRHCTACRATVRALHLSAGAKVKLLLPVLVLHLVARREDPAPAPSEALVTEARSGVLPELPDHIERATRLRLGRLRDELLMRINDLAAAIHIATATGGGRLATLGAIVGFCVSSIGAGALCVATGVVEAPKWILDRSEPRAKVEPRPTAEPPRRAASPPPLVVVRAQPTPTATPRPVVRRRPSSSAPRRRAQDKSQGTLPSSHESPPIHEAPAASVSEFSPEQSAAAGGGGAPADPAPATGGGEFMP